MASYGERRQLEVTAPAQACLDALLDVEHLPSWQRALRSATTLERDAGGHPTLVEYAVDARVRTVRYRIRQTIHHDPLRLVSEYAGGDFRDFAGEWRFEPLSDERTCVILDLHIDPGRLVPGPIRSLIADAVMRSALEDLKGHLERG